MERKAEIKLRLLQIEEKQQLLLAHKQLRDEGVDPTEIDLMFPLN
jgi:hypothetical protein